MKNYLIWIISLRKKLWVALPKNVINLRCCPLLKWLSWVAFPYFFNLFGSFSPGKIICITFTLEKIIIWGSFSWENNLGYFHLENWLNWVTDIDKWLLWLACPWKNITAHIDGILFSERKVSHDSTTIIISTVKSPL